MHYTVTEVHFWSKIGSQNLQHPSVALKAVAVLETFAEFVLEEMARNVWATLIDEV